MLLIGYLRKHGMLNKVNEQMHFARKRFGRYEVIDFLAVLFGYAISGERTLEEFSDSTPFMEDLYKQVLYNCSRLISEKPSSSSALPIKVLYASILHVSSAYF